MEQSSSPDSGRVPAAPGDWRAALRTLSDRLPYAHGWFVQQHQSRRLVWHCGHALESSSLIVKLPEERVTFVVLANSDGLSRWRSLGDGADVTASPAAMLFLNWHAAQQKR